MSLNKIMLIGNLGRDPELRYTQKQTPVCTMNIATTEKQKSASGEWVDHTEWHRVVIFGKQAENCSKYLAKGRQVYVEGRIRTNKWQDKEGKDRYTTEIWADSVRFIGGRSGAGAGQGSGGSAYDQGSAVDNSVLNSMPTADDLDLGSNSDAIDDDDIPF